jgi:ATP-dependent Clp protease ATP-binding subunit ClpC
MFERFTDRSRRVLVYAQNEARELNVNYIGTEHILLGLIREGDGIAAKALGALGVNYDSVRKKVEKAANHDEPASSASLPFTPPAKKVLELAFREAVQLGHNYIGTEHLLLGIVRESSDTATQILLDLGVESTNVREKVTQMMSGHSGSESGSPDVRGQRDSAVLRGIVRNIGQQMRPDLDASTLDDRAAQIADDLLAQLRRAWESPGTP